jgi:hypothetical protein
MGYDFLVPPLLDPDAAAQAGLSLRGCMVRAIPGSGTV